MLVAITSCPFCAGAIPREDHVEVRRPDGTEHYLLCDFCHAGLYMLTTPDGLADGYRVSVDRDGSAEFATFRAQLEAARAT